MNNKKVKQKLSDVLLLIRIVGSMSKFTFENSLIDLNFKGNKWDSLSIRISGRYLRVCWEK